MDLTSKLTEKESLELDVRNAREDYDNIGEIYEDLRIVNYNSPEREQAGKLHTEAMHAHTRAQKILANYNLDEYLKDNGIEKQTKRKED